jgi:hypothetical protein
MKMLAVISITVFLITTITFGQQPPPEMGEQPPAPTPNRIEVRFALGIKTIRCKYFDLSAKIRGQEVFAGKFSSGFQIPSDVADLSGHDTLELEFKCNRHQWHFKEVGERAFSEGYWWVGTDYPPFQETLQWPGFKDSAWIHYLIIKPTSGAGFTVYKHCPKRLKDQKPGPCYDD